MNGKMIGMVIGCAFSNMYVYIGYIAYTIDDNVIAAKMVSEALIIIVAASSCALRNFSLALPSG